MAVTFPTQTVAVNEEGTDPTFSHTSPSGTDTLLIYTNVTETETSPTGVTYAGAALTKLIEIDLVAEVRTQIWYKVNPATGANDIIVSGQGDVANHAAMTFHGADQTNPFGATPDTNSATGASGNPAVTITTAADNMTIDVNGFAREAGAVAPTNGSSVEVVETAIDRPKLVVSHTDTTGAITVGWTNTENRAWAIAVGDILTVAAAAAAPVIRRRQLTTVRM